MRMLIRITAVLLSLAGLTSVDIPSAGAATSGINDWSCTPSSAHPEPVVLVHGLGANKDINFVALGPAIRDAGYCVFSLTYGTTYYSDYIGGLASMRLSAAQIRDFVDKVQAATGAAKVDIVGHSEGTTVPAYYLKFLGGRADVKHFVGFGSNFKGSSLNGLVTLSDLLGFGAILQAGGCTACAEYSPSSDFIADLNAGGLTVAGPTYTSIVSTYDEVVTPYTSGLLPTAANTKNVVLQDVCGWDFSGHLGLAVSPNVAAIVLNELDPAHAKPVNCVWVPWVS